MIGLQDQKLEIMKEIHDEIGHKGRGATFEQAKRRYKWKGIFYDIDEWVKSCEECQKQASVQKRFTPEVEYLSLGYGRCGYCVYTAVE